MRALRGGEGQEAAGREQEGPRRDAHPGSASAAGAARGRGRRGCGLFRRARAHSRRVAWWRAWQARRRGRCGGGGRARRGRRSGLALCARLIGHDGAAGSARPRRQRRKGAVRLVRAVRPGKGGGGSSGGVMCSSPYALAPLSAGCRHVGNAPPVGTGGAADWPSHHKSSVDCRAASADQLIREAHARSNGILTAHRCQRLLGLRGTKVHHARDGAGAFGWPRDSRPAARGRPRIDPAADSHKHACERRKHARVARLHRLLTAHQCVGERLLQAKCGQPERLVEVDCRGGGGGGGGGDGAGRGEVSKLRTLDCGGGDGGSGGGRRGDRSGGGGRRSGRGRRAHGRWWHGSGAGGWQATG